MKVKIMGITRKMETIEVVSKFIEDFKSMHPKEIEDLFSYGYCYWFAKILADRFDGEIRYLPIKNHFFTRIAGEDYDISGHISHHNEEDFNWIFYQSIEPKGSIRIIRDCILKI